MIDSMSHGNNFHLNQQPRSDCSKPYIQNHIFFSKKPELLQIFKFESDESLPCKILSDPGEHLSPLGASQHEVFS